MTQIFTDETKSDLPLAVIATKHLDFTLRANPPLKTICVNLRHLRID